MVKALLSPVNEGPSSLATCPRMDTAAREPMASARYIRLLPRVAIQSRIVSAAMAEKAIALAMLR
jgi:hypothetical protein